MARQIRPTESEAEILGVLWERGSASVREVFEVLAPRRKTGYTTTLKLMQLMLEKGLLLRDESTRPHVYRSAVKPAIMQRQILSRLIDGLFAGSTSALVQQALGAGSVDPAELAEIRALLDAYDKKEGA